MSKKNKLQQNKEKLKVVETEPSATNIENPQVQSVNIPDTETVNLSEIIKTEVTNNNLNNEIANAFENKNKPQVSNSNISVSILQPEIKSKKISKKKIAITGLSCLIILLIFAICAILSYFFTSKYKEFTNSQIDFQNNLTNFSSKGFSLSQIENNYKDNTNLTNFLNFIVNPNLFANLNSEINSKVQSESSTILSQIDLLTSKLPTPTSEGIKLIDDKLTNLKTEIQNEISKNDLISAKSNIANFETQVSLRSENLGKLISFENEINQKVKNYNDAGINWNDDNLKTKLRTIVESLNSENYTFLDTQLNEYKDLVNVKLAQIDKNIQTDIDNFVRKYNSMYTICQVYGCKLNDKIEITGNTIFDKYKLTKSKFEENKKVLDDYVVAQGSKITSKRILVDVSKQYLYVIQDYEVIKSFASSTGDTIHPTKYGEFNVFEKIRNAWGYYRIWMPYWLSIYYAGGSVNGIHGIPTSPEGAKFTSWDNAVGRYPITYGCVMPRDVNAKWLYDWAEIGTSVSIVY